LQSTAASRGRRHYSIGARGMEPRRLPFICNSGQGPECASGSLGEIEYCDRAALSDPTASSTGLCSSWFSGGRFALDGATRSGNTLAPHFSPNPEGTAGADRRSNRRILYPVTISKIDPIRDPRWRALVEGHPQAGIFHTVGWLQALQRTYGFQAVAYTTARAGAELEDGIVFCHADSWLTGKRMISLPFSDHCQPLVESAGTLAE